MMGVGNRITVPCMARLGPRRGESGTCDPCDQKLSGSLVRRAFQVIYVRLQHQDLLHGQSDKFLRLNTLIYSLDKEAGGLL
jgi:hypothetical protein